MPRQTESTRLKEIIAGHPRRLALACLGILAIVAIGFSVAGCWSDGLRADPTQPPIAAVQPPDSGPPAAVRQPLAFPDRRFNRLFTRSDGGWTGSDGTSSVLLPDGRTLWMFGDTFLGTVRADRSRAVNSPMIRNAFVVQDGETLNTRYTNGFGAPADFVSPPGGYGWYWPGDASVEDGCLWVFMHRFQTTGTGMWDFQWIGTDLVSFALPGVEQKASIPVPNGNRVQYGAAVLEDGDYTLIYGTEDTADNKYTHLARARTGQISGSWQFYSADGWSDNATATQRLLVGVANQYSVLAIGNGYLLVTTDSRVPFSSRLVAYRSKRPAGPWRGPVAVYTAPEANGDVIAYNAFVHTQFTDGHLILISYNLNHISDFSAIFENADWYRPKFIRVDLPRLLEAFGADEVKQK